jgi:3-oxoadipate enol-lactonase
MLPTQQERVEVRDGELYVERTGSGPPVVLLHSGTLDASMWDDQVEALATDHEVIRYDARSHGRSSTARGDYRPDDDLLDLVTALGLGPAALVGNSLGGATAAAFALQHPERVSSLLLAGPGLTPMEFRDPFVQEQHAEQAAAIEARDPERYVEATLRLAVDGPHRRPDEVDPEVRRRCRAMCMGTVSAHHTSQGRMLERDVISRLEEIAVPTHLVIGEYELSDVRRVVDEAHRRMPDATLTTLPGVGHMTNMEAPDAFNSVLREHLGAGLASR